MIGLLSSAMIPLLVFFVILYGVCHQVSIYDVFIEGCKESFDLILSIFPSFLAMILGVNIFLNSGVLDVILPFLGKFLDFILLPHEVFPMAIIRPISGSSSLAILNHLFENYGPDSYIGILGSVIQGSTDTTFYILTLYFGSVGIKKIRYSLVAGLCADLLGVIASILVVNWLF